MADEQDEGLIELTDVVEDAAPGAGDDDIIELTDVHSGPGDDTEQAAEPELPDLPDLTAAQVEAALERVIEKKFSEKIESILFDVMEKVILKEISDIRRNLQKDLDEIGTD